LYCLLWINKETRHLLESLDDLYQYKDMLKVCAQELMSSGFQNYHLEELNMTHHEYLEDLASQQGIIIDYSLIRSDDQIHGLYIDFGSELPKVIMISRFITHCEQLAVLAEELGHHFASYGNIVAQQDVMQRKEEALGRVWAYEHLVPPGEVFSACMDGEGSPWELSDRLGLPEPFIREAITYYARKFGDIDLKHIRYHAFRMPA
jgi:hypothetical protein